MADQTESSITIAAPIATIMQVIADLEDYPDWSDGITKVTVLTEDGGRPRTARFELSSGPIKDTYELEYDWSGDAERQYSTRDFNMEQWCEKALRS